MNHSRVQSVLNLVLFTQVSRENLFNLKLLSLQCSTLGRTSIFMFHGGTLIFMHARYLVNCSWWFGNLKRVPYTPLHRASQYGVRNCSFKFSTSTLEFTAKFYTLNSSFQIHIIGKRFYICLLAFELNFFMWPCSLYIFNSTNKFLYTATFYQF